MISARRHRRDAGLESLLEAAEGMPADDVSRLNWYVALLKLRAVDEHAGRRGFPHSDNLSERLGQISRDQALDDLFGSIKF
ncbi:hypothetical protein HYU12_03700 [Candidatus Woesearchaeota archaeon]|nr:hypothetical protein [Candidatus Woesearchaeota archaeon]